MKYSVCILSAGRGIRLGPLTDNINKSLLPIDGKAIISHIIEKFPSDVGIVVAVGYQADKIREYLRHAHDDRDIQCVEVDNWDGPGAGPGYSLLCCKEKLQNQFIIYAADTILMEPVPPPTRNWLGVAPVDNTERFCTVSFEGDKINRLADKIKCDNRFAFVGTAGIWSHEEFWRNLECDDRLIDNELQLSNGLAGLILHDLYPERFTWYDTGTVENFEETRKILEDDEEKFNFDKINEFTYQINGRLVKYFSDPKIVKNRMFRAHELTGLIPMIRDVTTWFYSYEMVKGETVYECLTPRITHDFLAWAEKYLWTYDALYDNDPEAASEYREACDIFYHQKTIQRIGMFYDKYPELKGKPSTVNGVVLKPLSESLLKINWGIVAWGRPTNYHGDLQFDNVLRTGWLTEGKDAFKLIDWRQDFGGHTDIGDTNYDLAKLFGGLTIPYNMIKKNRFKYEETADGIFFDIDTTHSMNESQLVFRQFVEDNDYCLEKLELIRALIFLNMAPLHAYPFDKLLYYMGWSYLQDSVEKYDR